MWTCRTIGKVEKCGGRKSDGDGGSWLWEEENLEGTGERQDGMGFMSDQQNYRFSFAEYQKQNRQKSVNVKLQTSVMLELSE